MMFAITKHKEITIMKLICAGEDEKVFFILFYNILLN